MKNSASAMRRVRYGAVLVAALAFTACATTPQAPKIIEVPTVRYTPIPADLDADCPTPELQGRTWGDLADLVVKLRGAITQCNDRMAGIRAIQGSGK